MSTDAVEGGGHSRSIERSKSLGDDDGPVPVPVPAVLKTDGGLVEAETSTKLQSSGSDGSNIITAKHLSKDTSSIPTETNAPLTPSRIRANTAPAEVSASQQAQQQQTQPPTAPELQRKPSEEDDDIRIAKAMAMAISNNPKLPPEEIRELVGAPKSVVGSNKASSNSNSSGGGGGVGVSGSQISSRFTSMLQDFDKVIKGSVVTTVSSAQAAASSTTSGLTAFRLGDNLRKYVGTSTVGSTSATPVVPETDPFFSGLEAPSTADRTSSTSTSTNKSVPAASAAVLPPPKSPKSTAAKVVVIAPPTSTTGSASTTAAATTTISASFPSSNSGQQEQPQNALKTTTPIAEVTTTVTSAATTTKTSRAEKIKDVGFADSDSNVSTQPATTSTLGAATATGAATTFNSNNIIRNATQSSVPSNAAPAPATSSSSSSSPETPVSSTAVLNFLPTSFRTYSAGNLFPISTTALTAVMKPSSISSLGTAAATTNTNTTTTKSSRIRLSTLAWKRRGGMGKYSSLAWEQRRIELVGTRVLYYRNDSDEDGGDGQSYRSEDDIGQGGPEGVVVVNKRANWLEQAAASWSIADPTSPRGYIDLAKEKATASAAFGHSGAPSPFAISIKVRGETKWKLCFDYHKTQMEWLAAITDVVVQASVDAYNANLLAAADPSNVALTENLFSYPPASTNSSAGGGSSSSTSADQQPHRLWMLEPYVIESGGVERTIESDDEESKFEGTECNYDDDGPELVMSTVTTSSTTATTMMETTGEVVVPDHTVARETAKLEAATTWCIPEYNLWYVCAFVNAALFYARSSSTSMEGFWYLVVVTNFGLLLASIQEPKWQSILEHVRHVPTFTASALVPTITSSIAGIGKGDGKGCKIAPETDALLGSAPVAPIQTKPSFFPLAGSSTVRLKTPVDPPVNSKNQAFAGWCPSDPKLMLVRSHGYLETKAKVPSPGELYECVQVDIFESPQRYPDMGTRVKLPEVNFLDKGAKTWHMPDIFVVSIALPTDPPKFGRTSSDGGGYTITVYFRMHQETRDILRRVTADGYDPSQEEVPADPQMSRVNAVRLMEEWCRRAPTDPKYQARFKVVPNAHNLEEIGMPNWIAKYNGKPFLVKRAGQTGFLYNHPELSCMEFDVSLHPFPYLAKQAICFMKESYFKCILVSFGFCIEGRSDDELPECLIGAMQLCYPDPNVAIQASDFFAGRARNSFD